MTSKIVFGMLALTLLLVACAQAPEETVPEEPTVPEPVAPEDTPIPDETGSGDEMIEEETPEDENLEEESDVVTFQMTGENFRFRMDGEVNPTLRVQQGDVVRVEFSSTDGFHDWVVDEFGAATSRVRPEDGMTVVEFVASETGEFPYYCSVGSHRANGMEGMLVVE